MAYLFVFLALMTSQLNSYCGKKTSGLLQETSSAFLFYWIRMFLCTIIGLLIVAFSQGVTGVAVDAKLLIPCVIGGFFTAWFMVTWLWAVGCNTILTVEVALMAGSLIPIFGTAILFNEKLVPSKFVGFALITVAMFLLTGYNKKLNGKPTIKSIFFMVATSVSEGAMGLCQQVFKYTIMPENPQFTSAVYNFYTYLFAFVTLFVALLILQGKHFVQKEPGCVFNMKKMVPVMLYVVIISAGLFCNSYFQLLATANYGMTSQVMYPLMKGGALLVTTLMACIFFGEKITVKSVIGTIVAFAGVICVNVLNF